jgi:putative DNA primase/helicase
MGDAAIVYVAYGLPVFPVEPINKHPIPRRDTDPTGQYPKGIPGTGGFYKATCSPDIIERWWQANPRALIGLPMGKRAGVWALDVDTSEDHADGLAEWGKLTAQHDPIVTREHRSATGGPHLIFNWDKYNPVHCSAGGLPAGIEVKGQGGYVVVPPSRRKGRAYTVHSDINPIAAPKWLTDLILPNREQLNGEAHFNGEAYYSGPVTADLEDLADAMLWVPNDDAAQPEYNSMGLRLWAATGGSDEGFELFDAWARKSKKYHGGTKERWQHYFGSPPDRTGANKIFKIAREHGWVPKPKIVSPTYPADDSTAGEARDQTRQHVREFLDLVDRCKNLQGNSSGVYSSTDIYDLLLPSTAWALRIPTGIGKTQITIEELAKWIPTNTAGAVIYAVPRHKLGQKIEEQFTTHGIDARVFRGREADDPEQPGKKMCLNLPAVALALKCHADIASTCCKSKRGACRFFGACGYQRQKPSTPPSVWIVASDMLFHNHKVFGNPVAVIADESFWPKGLRGIEPEQNKNALEVALDGLLGYQPDRFEGGDIGQRDYLRFRLAELLYLQEADSGVERRLLDSFISIEDCERAIELEWKCIPKLALYPGMTDAEISALAARDSARINAIQHTRRIIKIWEAVRELLDNPEIEVSGRLLLKQKKAQRYVVWRGVDTISKKFSVPTLLLDATLPDISILRIYHFMASIIAEIDVALPPHVHIRQILQTPTSSNKLNKETHLEAVRRYLLQRWFETGRKPTLIICQEKVEEWLMERGLPDNIEVKHYNDVAGLDDYKNVRLLMLVGRTAPGPQAMEALAAALSGVQPVLAAPAPHGFAWYNRVKRGIRLADGHGVETDGDLHPDPLAEAVRWQVHEGELVQAFGRARAINRTAETPLDVDLLFNTCLPVTVNEVVTWTKPSLLIETAQAGVMLTSAVDMVKLWPELWPYVEAARKTVNLGVPVLPGFVEATYQLAGPKMNRRLGFFDLTVIPDPAAWLAARLGPLAGDSCS